MLVTGDCLKSGGARPGRLQSQQTAKCFRQPAGKDPTFYRTAIKTLYRAVIASGGRASVGSMTTAHGYVGRTSNSNAQIRTAMHMNGEFNSLVEISLENCCIELGEYKMRNIPSSIHGRVFVVWLVAFTKA